MSVLVISPGAKEVIKQVIDYAEKNRHTFEQMLLRKSKELPPPGDDPGFVADIHTNFRVVFSIEQNEKMDWYKHLSVSIGIDKLPSVIAVQVLMKEFEMGDDITISDFLWIEEIDKDHSAVNVLVNYPNHKDRDFKSEPRNR